MKKICSISLVCLAMMGTAYAVETVTTTATAPVAVTAGMHNSSAVKTDPILGINQPANMTKNGNSLYLEKPVNLDMYTKLRTMAENSYARLTHLAENGDVKAQYALGYLYYKGEGVEQSDMRAFEWITRAAEAGYAKAQYELGVIYYYGFGQIYASEKEAAIWYERAAQNGFAKAQYVAGRLYLKGYGVKKSYPKAFKYFQRAADQSVVKAQYELGYMYQHGYGVKKSYEEAYKWYMRAADKKDGDAAYALGEMYRTGKFVKKSNVDAYNWFLKASQSEDQLASSNANIALTDLQKVLTPAERQQLNLH
ncbi:tetratricopeptide repeat protein [Actinobacillus delphinicola]|uniref:Beta-lactamase hcpC n=1 Tax=Actinobacillus delphinicola TaxID=51161 RepID=A0A448TVW2_9PAST|nr:tetratricopeptide repeat protein [Actinobacillus delphinicola]VEJ10071.1 Putative beta-lactamase hcpC precursor [Actinobacillus delphinicola]